jgi:hypothetical protein
VNANPFGWLSEACSSCCIWILHVLRSLHVHARTRHWLEQPCCCSNQSCRQHGRLLPQGNKPSATQASPAAPIAPPNAAPAPAPVPAPWPMDAYWPSAACYSSSKAAPKWLKWDRVELWGWRWCVSMLAASKAWCSVVVDRCTQGCGSCWCCCLAHSLLQDQSREFPAQRPFRCWTW